MDSPSPTLVASHHRFPRPRQEFWYTGMPELLTRHPLLLAASSTQSELCALQAATTLFEAPPLEEAVVNARAGRGELNPSIGTHQMDVTGGRLIDLFLGKTIFADATVQLRDGRLLPVVSRHPSSAASAEQSTRAPPTLPHRSPSAALLCILHVRSIAACCVLAAPLFAAHSCALTQVEVRSS